ncbi:prefoldin subunit alpha [Candidatus Woesearchaeota archaeon]|nr:prefoldin subunit alpha [Candidatus Woesearchaeota archaeon]
MTQEQDWQEKYKHFQMLQEHIEQMTHHVQMLAQQSEELEISKNALIELAKTAEGTEILAPISNGIFIKSTLVDNKKVIVNVGSNTTVERTIPEAVDLLEKEHVKIRMRVIEAEKMLQNLHQETMKIHQEVEVAGQ